MSDYYKTAESPCRRCQNIHENKEECAKDCAKLSAYQVALLRREEMNIKKFEFRCPASSGK